MAMNLLFLISFSKVALSLMVVKAPELLQEAVLRLVLDMVDFWALALAKNEA